MTAVIDLSGVSVLIVEDEFYLAMEMQDEIERAGGTVVGPCADAAGALGALRQSGADVALLDINLGYGPSFEIADALRAADMPFAFLTGYDPAVIPERFSDVPCVSKPANEAMLLRALQEIIRP